MRRRLGLPDNPGGSGSCGFCDLSCCILFCKLHRGFQDFTIHLRQICEEFWGRKGNENSSHSQAMSHSEDRRTQLILIDGYEARPGKSVLCVRTAAGKGRCQRRRLLARVWGGGGIRSVGWRDEAIPGRERGENGKKERR